MSPTICIDELAINVNPSFAVMKDRIKRMAAARHATQRERAIQERQPALSVGREFRSGVMSATNKDRSSVRPPTVRSHVSISEDAVALSGGNIYNEVNNPNIKKIVNKVQQNLLHSNDRVGNNKRRAQRIFAAMKSQKNNFIQTLLKGEM